ELYQAASEPKQLWIIDDVPHCSAYFADRIGYSQRVAGFFSHALLMGPGHGNGARASQASLPDIERLRDR
ncbi:MAG TPA: hypothetical protein VFS96_04830, partial [Nitrolancea sp.]|nr:hypothetical protein [Nitrolancea sp.]